MLKIRIKNHFVNTYFQLSNIRINVLPKDIYALIGKSGSGKSTLSKIIVGLSTNELCSIKINGIELNNNLERLIPKYHQAGYLPQNLHLKPYHTVNDFLDYIFQNSFSPKFEKKKNIKSFHLQKIVRTKISQLSGGEKQKLAILEAISNPIEYLVLDEPFSQLDIEQKIELTNILKEVINTKNIPCILISHELTDVLKLSHYIGVIDHGKIIFNGELTKLVKSKNQTVLNLKKALFDSHDANSIIIENLKKL